MLRTTSSPQAPLNSARRPLLRGLSRRGVAANCLPLSMQLLPTFDCTHSNDTRTVLVRIPPFLTSLAAAAAFSSSRRRDRKKPLQRPGTIFGRTWPQICRLRSDVSCYGHDSYRHSSSCGAVVQDVQYDELSVDPCLLLALAIPTGSQAAVIPTLAAAIVCHEAGHFLCARSIGLEAEEFSIGFGPAGLVLGQDTPGTDFTLRIFPFGGYVRFDDRKTCQLSDGTRVNEFESMSAPARLWVLSGGVIANLLAGWCSLCLGALTAGVPQTNPLPGIRVEDVSEEAASRTGLHSKDVILRIGTLDLSSPGASVRSTVDFIHKLPANSPVELEILRDNQRMFFEVVPISDIETGFQRLGVTINTNAEKIMQKADDFFGALAIANDSIWRLLAEQVQALQSLASGSGSGELVGPVGIVKQGGDLASSEGIVGLGLFFVTINLNLALLNALPVPGLDGGKAVFVLFESVTGRRIDEQSKQKVETLFVVLVLTGVLTLTAKDLAKLFVK